MKTYKTAESVCAGHPDKLCDFISDSILDACLYKDKSSRVACEVMATRHRIIVAGEISCSKSVDIRYEVRRALQKLGYNPFAYLIYVFVHKQSKDIAGGVDLSVEARNGDTSCYAHLGAGDQGTVYGYATDETDEYIPLPLLLSHKICKRLDSVRRDNIIRGIKPDGKAQVTVEYANGKPKRVKTIVVSVQHGKDKDLDVLKNEIISEVLHPVFRKFPFDADADTEGLNFRKAFIDAGFHLAGVCIWVKNSLVLGRSDYQWQHEPVLYGFLQNGKHPWYSDRKQTTIWNYDKPKRNANHPTSKPLDLLGYPICNSSQENAIVIDTFGGSGSTMMACQQTNRICHMMELDEKYASVILRRAVENGIAPEDIFVERDGKQIPYADLVKEVELPDGTE